MEEASAGACPYLEAVARFMMFMFMFETYLDIRQHAALKLSNLPAPLKGVVSQDKFEKARAYSLDKSRFHFVLAPVNIVEESAVLLLGLLPWAWYASESVVRGLGFDETSEVLHTLCIFCGHHVVDPGSGTAVFAVFHVRDRGAAWVQQADHLVVLEGHGGGVGAHGGCWPSHRGGNYFHRAEWRSIPGTLVVGVHVAALARGDGFVSDSHRASVQQIHPVARGTASCQD